LSCLLEGEVENKIREFHKGDCGGHHYWKNTLQKILRDGFYWPSIFYLFSTKTFQAIMNANFFMGRENCILFP